LRMIDADELAMDVLGLTIVDPVVVAYANSVLRFIQQAPTIDAEPVRHGRWIMRGGKRYCSYCNKRACVTRDREDFWYTVGTEYCPTCGAIMDGGASDD
jgi:hypothetical protein